MTVDLTGNGARQVLIQSTGINVVVRAVVVFVNRGAGVPDTGNYASVSLTSTSGSSIGFVEQFIQGGGTGNLKIAGIEAFGNPGQIGIPCNEIADLIEADDIGQIRASGDVYSDIIVTTPASGFTLPGDVFRVEGTGTGRLYGNVTTPRGAVKFIEFFGGHIGDLAANPPVYPTIDSVGELTLIQAKSISASITGDGGSGCSCLRRIRATDGSITGSITAQILGESTDGASGLFITNGQLDADIALASNLRGGLIVNGTIPGGIAFPETRSMIIRSGIQPNAAPVDIAGQLRGQVVLNAQNGTPVWGTSTTINGLVLAVGATLVGPSTNFEFDQSSADLGGGTIGMAPFRLWKSDCHPV